MLLSLNMHTCKGIAISAEMIKRRHREGAELRPAAGCGWEMKVNSIYRRRCQLKLLKYVTVRHWISSSGFWSACLAFQVESFSYNKQLTHSWPAHFALARWRDNLIKSYR